MTTGPVSVVAFRPDGHTLAATTDNGVAGLWNLNADDAIRRICKRSAGALSRQQWNRTFRSSRTHRHVFARLTTESPQRLGSGPRS
ncbi:hypothetical protein [Streptomyces halobius]|uniref:Uncharacterized protein n=1 Tax=Streptomyces halobius TaxID=2879846 RepID=A0ABY4MJH5_9ACTN|nr:hypothetical protein [Streptomyces halobius]UQA97367.1 hypothetical protein K9S39_40835 [Streptomyces halobius]